MRSCDCWLISRICRTQTSDWLRNAGQTRAHFCCKFSDVGRRMVHPPSPTPIPPLPCSTAASLCVVAVEVGARIKRFTVQRLLRATAAAAVARLSCMGGCACFVALSFLSVVVQHPCASARPDAAATSQQQQRRRRQLAAATHAFGASIDREYCFYLTCLRRRQLLADQVLYIAREPVEKRGLFSSADSGS
jgi:hypothetical protein